MVSKKINRITNYVICCLILIFCISVINVNSQTVETSSTGVVSDKKIEWGIKRGDNHEQPDLGSENRRIIDQYEGISIGNSEKPYIYLTFDCGYENGFTPKILDVLKKKKVPAAFFVTKPFIRENPDLVKRMKKEGHVVGNHTVHHKSMPGLSDRNNKQEISDCAEYCREATGYDMDLFIRPPMGEYSEQTLALTKKMGYKTIFWSMAYVDFKVDDQPGKQYVIDHFDQYAHNGAIPLMHNVSESNAEALGTVIDHLKKEGYEFLSLKKLPDY